MKAVMFEDSELVMVLTRFEAEALLLAASMGRDAAREVQHGRASGSLDRTLEQIRKVLKPKENSVFGLGG